MQIRHNAIVTKTNETKCKYNEMQKRQDANVIESKWDKMQIGRNANEP